MLRRHSRYNVAHSTYFVTTTIVERGNWLVSSDVCIRLSEIIEDYRAYYNLLCIGYCLMPDHLHLILNQQQDGLAVSHFMERVKGNAQRMPPRQ